MKDYQKVMLYVYPRIEKIVRDIDGIVEAQALCCFSAESCLRTAERIAEHICAKSSFLLLKDFLEKIIGELSRDELYMLEYKYFRRRKKLEGEFCGFVLGCNERTYFRKQARLADKLNASFLREGLDEAWFSKHFSNVGFMMSACEAVKNRGGAQLTDKRRVKSLSCVLDSCAQKKAR